MRGAVRAGLILAVIVMGACDAPEALVDAGELAPDASSAGDAGGDAGKLDASEPVTEPDADVRDSGPDELDAGTDGGPEPEPLPTCDFEGVQRYEVTWCDYVPAVIRDYDCVLIWQYHSGGSEWFGTAEAVRTATFTIDFDGISPYGDAMYACHRPAPTELYRQNCETPFRRPCALAESHEQHRGGADYRPLCDAAQERGLALVVSLNSPNTGCRD